MMLDQAVRSTDASIPAPAPAVKRARHAFTGPRPLLGMANELPQLPALPAPQDAAASPAPRELQYATPTAQRILQALESSKQVGTCHWDVRHHHDASKRISQLAVDVNNSCKLPEPCTDG